MKHFEHLKLRNHKGINECVLADLGKINIFCGKNNSGKTTILESIKLISGLLQPFKESTMLSATINNWKNSLVGINISDGTLKEMCNQLNPSVSISDSDILKKMVSQSWFINEEERFTQYLTSLIGGNLPLNFGSLSYKSLFEKSLNQKIELIPSKRNIQFYVDISSDLNIEAFGSGILKTLFQYKTQNKSSVLYKIYQKIEFEFSRLTNGINLDVNSTDDGRFIQLTFSNENDKWIRADNCGMGLQDLLIILYFAIDPKYQIILLEEPENHLHPEIQRKLLYFLKHETEKQYFISTHSNIFLDTSLVDKIYFTSFDVEVKVSDETSKTEILNQLGYSVSDNLVSDLILLVEGLKDKIVLEELLRKKELIPRFFVKFWFLGGQTMEDVDLSGFAENYKMLALVDLDPEGRTARETFIANCEKYKIPVQQLERYSMENYIPLHILKDVYGKQIQVDMIDPMIKLQKQIGINIKKKMDIISSKLKLEHIQDTDLYKFIEKIESVLTPKIPKK